MSTEPAALIAGIGTTPSSLGTDRSALELAASAADRALADATLGIGDIDGLWACNPIAEPHLMFATLLAERLDAQPRTVRTVQEAGSGPFLGLAEAVRCVSARRCDAALVVEADNRGTARRAHRLNQWWVDPIDPEGLSAVAGFAALAARYLHSRGLNREQVAEVSVAAREHATRDPEAIFHDPIDMDEVLGAPEVVAPLHRLDCCPVGDWSGALVVTREPVAKKPEVRVLGLGESHGPLHHWLVDVERETPIAQSARLALGQAGLAPGDLDAIELFDAFSFCTPLLLEEIGLWPRLEIAERVAAGALRPGARPGINTHGGLLNHGNAHVRILAEAALQLRGEGGERQVPDARRIAAVGAGGVLSSTVTVVLGR